MTTITQKKGNRSMNDASSPQGLSILRDPLLRNALILVAALAGALFVARAPTSYTGELPVIGDYVPLKLNAVYIVVFAPILATIACVALLIEASQQSGGQSWSRSGRKRNNRTLLAIVFAVIVGLTTAVSLQYFLILAPAELCPTRPHFDLLWTNLPGHNRITHCMSGTEEINKATPYYVEPQLLQAWAYVACLIATPVLLGAAWWRLGR
ncbi:hypothetical protein [Methylobacterium bullatum]